MKLNLHNVWINFGAGLLEPVKTDQNAEKVRKVYCEWTSAQINASVSFPLLSSARRLNSSMTSVYGLFGTRDSGCLLTVSCYASVSALNAQCDPAVSDHRAEPPPAPADGEQSWYSISWREDELLQHKACGNCTAANVLADKAPLLFVRPPRNKCWSPQIERDQKPHSGSDRKQVKSRKSSAAGSVSSSGVPLSKSSSLNKTNKKKPTDATFSLMLVTFKAELTGILLGCCSWISLTSSTLCSVGQEKQGEKSIRMSRRKGGKERRKSK